jgi:hypothetical protein
MINTFNDVMQKISVLKSFMNFHQLEVFATLYHSIERQFFIDKLNELVNTVNTMPKTYEQDGKGDEAVAYLHYFKNGSDWYITEKDMYGDDQQHQAFGFAILNGDIEMAEKGYISIVELLENQVELDLYFTPTSIKVIKSKVEYSEEV